MNDAEHRPDPVVAWLDRLPVSVDMLPMLIVIAPFELLGFILRRIRARFASPVPHAIACPPRKLVRQRVA